ncbi:class I SAM-dependent methyltransferase [Pedobacter jejuensis]|uniref:Class I SAM-dependent methyltransferase n=1 Tax=Pedobacter jejuensis TaxID=1268550 RepID=A0A3N0C2Y8_9SPHI|nr:class I SAM-dependent methyltransferase [Pedobacter jejuensis]RNL56922.1 class I SAM-dependent methyltransferase [Pedobacter jejuensis]
MINITCPICLDNKTNLNPVIFTVKTNSGDLYQIRECQNCKHIYTYFDHEVDIASYYDEKDYVVKDTKETIFFKIQKLEYNIVIDKIKKYNSLPATLLDFGSGKGLFLHFAKNKGYDVKGIESSLPRAKYAQKHFDLDINTDYYANGNVFGKKFDVLTLFHVLEHIHLSDNLLENLISNNLKTNGLLVVEVPNFSSWQSKWVGNRWLHLDVPRHISHFTPLSLKNLLSKSGCVVQSESYFSFHLGIVGMAQTILSWFGYKGFLIADLKRKKTMSLMLGLAFTLPFAVILESLAATFKKGGVIRYYAVNKGLS